LDDFSPEDIESIEIIKGPAAATLYGTEAANGVIQIITKRGAEGAVTFDLAIREGINWFPNPRRYFGNKWYQDPSTSGLVSTYLYDTENEYRSSVLGTSDHYVENGRNQYYHIGANGGTAIFRFAASLDADFEDGVFPDHPNTNDRFSGRLNLDFLKGEEFPPRGGRAPGRPCPRHPRGGSPAGRPTAGG
jgi:TonB-dependent SusC/RagA subfamily outer membrane receptor